MQASAAANEEGFRRPFSSASSLVGDLAAEDGACDSAWCGVRSLRVETWTQIRIGDRYARYQSCAAALIRYAESTSGLSCRLCS